MRAAGHRPRHSSGTSPGASDTHPGRWSPAGWQLSLSGLLLAGLWALVLSSFTSVFSTGAWWAQSVLVSAVTVLTSVVVRIRLNNRRLLPAFLGACGGALCAGWFVYASGRLSFWRHELPMMFNQASEVLNSGPAPVDPAGPLADLLLVIVVLLSAVTALVLVGLGSPLAAGVSVAVLLLVPSGVTGISISSSMLLAAGVVLGMLAWAGSASPSPTGLLVVGAAMILTVVAMSLAPATRDRVFDNAVLPAPVSGAVPDVTVTLADDLRERNSTRAFSFTATEPGPYRFTLATLADFTGGRWLPEDDIADEGLTVDQPRSAVTMPPDQGTGPAAATQRERGARVTVSVQALRSPWLPLPQFSTGVAPDETAGGFDPREWQWTAQANTAHSEDAVTQRGDEYTADAGQLVADADIIEQAGTVPDSAGELIPEITETAEELAEYLELPDEMPQQLADTAAGITEGAQDRLAVGEALEEFFRSGEFTYDESAPYQPGADPGDPYAVMVGLLEQQRGFCVHYASTFAVMAREAGAPARVALGYASRAAAEEETAVRNSELHAWPEIYIDQLGWVAFEPTPGGAGVQADREAAILPEPEENPDPESSPSPSASINEPQPEPSEPDAPDDSAGETPETQPPSAEEPEDQESRPTGTSGAGPWLWLAPLLLVLLAPAGWRMLRRQRRYRNIGRGRRPGEHAWAEVLNTVADLRLIGTDSQTPAPRARTATALIEHLKDRDALTTGEAEAARAVADAAETERYSLSPPRPAPAELREHLRQVRQGLLSQASVGARLRARFLPGHRSPG